MHIRSKNFSKALKLMLLFITKLFAAFVYQYMATTRNEVHVLLSNVFKENISIRKKKRLEVLLGVLGFHYINRC